MGSKRTHCYGKVNRRLQEGTTKDYRHMVFWPDAGLLVCNGRLSNHPHPVSLSDTFQSSILEGGEREREKRKEKKTIIMTGFHKDSTQFPFTVTDRTVATLSAQWKMP